MDLLPDVSYAPDLYALGDGVEDWAHGALTHAKGDNIVVVGCSVGGSCALEVAKIAPDRVSALVLIGTKAVRRPDPALHRSSLTTIEQRGLEAAWDAFWRPLFSAKTDAAAIERARSMALRQSAEDVRRGVTVFHTRPSRDDVLTKFPGPIVLISGDDDIAPGPQRTRQQAQIALNARLEIVPDCGHYVPIEAPQRLNKILQRVLHSL
jgi:pimeloyl-[acyl-carrier protein] methyl ester esterase